MKRKVLLLFLAAALNASQGSTDELRYESKRLGVRFRYPQHFLVAQPAKLPGSEKRAEAMARRGVEYIPPDEESLVERRLAEGQDLKALRRDILQIRLSRSRGEEADFLRHFILKDEVRQRPREPSDRLRPGDPGAHREPRSHRIVKHRNRRQQQEVR